MSSTTSGASQRVELDAGHKVYALTFTENCEHLVSGGESGVQVWQVKDGEPLITLRVKGRAWCVAASKDGRWIAAGCEWGSVLVWNARTYELVFMEKRGVWSILDLDFCSDSVRLVSADSNDDTATVWDISAHREVRTLEHSGSVRAAKYSPQGDQIATASEESIRVWDGNNGRLLVDIKVGADLHGGLLWFKKYLFVKAKDRKIEKIDTSTRSTIPGWSVPYADVVSSIAMPQHGKFIAYSSKENIAFWDTTTHTQLGLVPQSCDTCPIAFSPDGQLAFLAQNGRITIKNLSFISDPDIHIDRVALDLWKSGQLIDTEALLTKLITKPDKLTYHVLACRALVRVRLGEWDAALVDAEESVKIRQSPLGYIAKCVSLVRKGDKHAGCQVCDIALQRFHSNHVAVLLLVKAVVLFMAKEHDDAISRIDALIAMVDFNATLYVVQAYMYFLCGNLHMERRNYKRAIQSFKDAQLKLGNRTILPPLIISLISGWKFDDLTSTIQRCLCEALLAEGRVKEASESVLRMVDQKIHMTEPIKAWVPDFRSRCRKKLEALGKTAMNATRYDEAISQYTVALSLYPALPDLLVKRCKAHAAKGSWKDALNDANEVIRLDSVSWLGYERKHEALCGTKQYKDAINAFETMLLKMSESPDPDIRERSRRYVRPEETREAIRTAIKKAILDSPLVLININSGRLCDRSQQAAAFESMPIFAQLVSAMTTRIDYARIEREVDDFYRYATLSHTWEDDEPLFQKVRKVVVYDLKGSPTRDKLREFCKIVREEGFNWAWSDTCCINQKDHVVLQEALVSMFKWYEGSTLTIIFLRGVGRLATRGALTKSKWNTRGWTLQEYHASKVVRIYTEDWTPYLGLTISNHKGSPEVVLEMEEATGISAQALMALRPGPSDIRKKLCLASTRKTTKEEDAAYSLLGIFSANLTITYGEGDKALARLLSQLLTSSGDSSILAWRGESGSFNSCLPAQINVFSESPTSHIPPPISDVEMGTIVAGLRTSSLDLASVTRLYDTLRALSMPCFVGTGQRMRLPCLVFETTLTASSRGGSEYVFKLHATALGAVEIKTKENLALLESLSLVHPWHDFLLDRHPIRHAVETTDPGLSSASRADDVLPTEKVLQFVARLKQPFGALLLTPTRRNAEEYRRVAAESLITVRLEELTPATLNGLIQCVRMLDVI